MAAIDDKIRQFKEEVGNASLTEQQQRIYNVFVRTSGKAVPFTVTDKDGKVVRFYVYSNLVKEGTQHILTKHYKGKEGRVSAFDILNICDTVRFGDIVVNDNKHICYKWTREVGGKKLITSLKIIKAGHILKSFYSEDKEKVSSPRLSSSPHRSARGNKSSRLVASGSKPRAKVVKKSNR